MPSTTVDKLNQLIESCLDYGEEFTAVAANLDDLQVRNVFKGLSDQLLSQALELQSAVAQLGEKPVDDLALAATLRHGWKDLRSTLRHDDAEGMLKVAASAEASVLHDYDDAMKIDELPTFVRVLLGDHREVVARMVDRLDDMSPG